MAESSVKRFERIAWVSDSLANCRVMGNAQWAENWQATLDSLLESSPHGSGFDNGTTFDFVNSNGTKLVFYTAFHHMDENGSYDGWTEHRITVKPHFIFGLTIDVSGRDRNDIKDYIAEVFRDWLTELVDTAPIIVSCEAQP